MGLIGSNRVNLLFKMEFYQRLVGLQLETEQPLTRG